MQSIAMSLIAVTELLVHLRSLESFSKEADGIHKVRVRLHGNNFQEDSLEVRKLREKVDSENTWYSSPYEVITLQRDARGKLHSSESKSDPTMIQNQSGFLRKDPVTESKGSLTKSLPLFFDLGCDSKADIDTFLLYRFPLPFPGWKGYLVLILDLCLQVVPVHYTNARAQSQTSTRR